ncbi:hypothetical protein Bbelb_100440 [Branchiostoma belcheri]|nr:hypothetical protein Bbelb_100440 [Branchiostoma belcheri]
MYIYIQNVWGRLNAAGSRQSSFELGEGPHLRHTRLKFVPLFDGTREEREPVKVVPTRDGLQLKSVVGAAGASSRRDKSKRVRHRNNMGYRNGDGHHPTLYMRAWETFFFCVRWPRLVKRAKSQELPDWGSTERRPGRGDTFDRDLSDRQPGCALSWRSFRALTALILLHRRPRCSHGDGMTRIHTIAKVTALMALSSRYHGDLFAERVQPLCAFTAHSLRSFWVVPSSALSRKRYESVQNSRRGDGTHCALRALFARSRGEHGDLSALNLTGDSGSFNSSNYPDNYPDDHDCKYEINVTPPMVIKLTFDEFDVEKNYDYVYVYDGSTTDSTFQIAKLTGRKILIPPPVTSTGSSMTVRLVTDHGKNRKGFRASYVAEDKVYSNCGVGQYRCANGVTCIDAWKRCDGNNDCRDNSDEDESHCGRSGIDARHSHGFARCESVVCTPRLAVSGCVYRTLRKW